MVILLHCPFCYASLDDLMHPDTKCPKCGSHCPEEVDDEKKYAQHVIRHRAVLNIEQITQAYLPLEVKLEECQAELDVCKQRLSRWT